MLERVTYLIYGRPAVSNNLFSQRAMTLNLEQIHHISLKRGDVGRHFSNIGSY